MTWRLGSEATDRWLFSGPKFEVCKEFFPELLPIDGNLKRAEAHMNILPSTDTNEGTNMVSRAGFRAWMQAESSCLLWIDGYQIPHHRPWTTDFAINVVRAGSANGFGTLFYFGSLHDNEPHPRSLIQTLVFHILTAYPELSSRGDKDLFSAEIFVVAKTNLDLSWRIFVECLRLIPTPVIYLTVEGIDHIGRSGCEDDFNALLEHLKVLATPG